MTQTTTMTETCVHHWVLGVPEDEVVRGRCKRCGAVREYPASIEQAPRGPYDEAARIVSTVQLLPDLEPQHALTGSAPA
jgi:hypothetical protein